MSLSDYNYLNDSRNRPAAAQVLYFEHDDGSIEEIELPTKWDVCSVCDGEGQHVNPSIDAGGISACEFDTDPDFAEAYFGGTYDVVCNRCHGRTTERVVDWDALTPEQAAAYERQLEEEARDRAYELAEIRMGA